MNDGKEPRRFSLRAEDGLEEKQFDSVLIIGRMPQAEIDGESVAVDLIIDDEMISRIHARISASENGAVVEDLKSVNGTFVNDQRVTGNMPAINGDRIRFDKVEFVLVDNEAPEKPVATTPTEVVPEQAKGTIVRPVEHVQATVDSADESGEKGGTVVLPVNRNLPKAWMPGDESGSDTVVVSADQVTPIKDIDADRLEKEADGPTLLIVSGTDAGKPLRLECSGEINFWNIGSDPSQHDLSIVFSDSSVSGIHAKLVRRGTRWKIIDSMSKNHTYVNGEPFSAAYLQSKDVVRLGEVQCLLLLPSKARTFGDSRSWWRRLFSRLRVGH